MATRTPKLALVLALAAALVEAGMLAHCTSQGATYDLASRLNGAARGLVKDEHQAVIRELRDPAALNALAQWAGVRPGWSEHPIRFPWTPACCAIWVEFQNKAGELMGGLGVSEHVLWYYPSEGATTRISTADREEFFRLVRVPSPFAQAQ